MHGSMSLHVLNDPRHELLWHTDGLLEIFESSHGVVGICGCFCLFQRSIPCVASGGMSGGFEWPACTIKHEDNKQPSVQQLLQVPREETMMHPRVLFKTNVGGVANNRAVQPARSVDTDACAMGKVCERGVAPDLLDDALREAFNAHVYN